MSENTNLPAAGFLSRKRDQMPASLLGGKIPPQDIPMEQAIIGAILLERQAVFKALEYIKTSEPFFKDAHRLIYDACLELVREGRPVDLLMVVSKLRQSGRLEDVGGPFYLTELTTKVASSSNIAYHCEVVIQKHIQRGRIIVAQQMLQDAYDDTSDPFTGIENDRRNLEALIPDTSMIEEFTDLAVEAIKDVEDAIAGKINPIYIGLRDVDNEFAFDGGELVVIGGKPGTGKTSVFTTIAKGVRRMNPDIPVLFNSLEMKGKKIVSRDMASTIKVSQMRFRTGKGIDKHHFEDMQDSIQGYSGIYSIQCWTVEQLRVKVRSFRRVKKIPATTRIALVFDYIQIAKGEKAGNREQEVSSISRGLKQLAEEENVLMLAGSQLNKESGKNRPTAANLRESEGIRNDADWVILLWSPSQNDVEFYEDGSSTANVVEAIFDKVRFGKPGQIIKLHMSDYGLIGDMPDRNYDDEIGPPPKFAPNMKHFSEPRHSEDQPDAGTPIDNFPF